jgi:NAD(P)-dependent dehydrogenase (short-subunit alcohol dehydrogenase family)
MPGLLMGRVAIITGAASVRGIGWACGRLFAGEGATLALLDLDAGAAQAAADALGPGHRGLACDVRDAARCEAGVAQVLAEFGRLDILVNNAGVSQPHRLMDGTQDDYDLVFDSSVRGTYNMSRSVVPHFRRQRSGVIVCMGSMAAQRGGGILGGPHYAAAKGAVQAMAKAMARELGPDNVRVNALSPGLVETDLLLGKLTDDGRARAIANTPTGRLARPEDIAGACLFLASDLSSFVTGTVLDVNGGLHIH